MDIQNFPQNLMRAYELGKELEQLETEFIYFAGLPVKVQEDGKTKTGHIGIVDGEHGRVLIEFGLRSATDARQKFYSYHDFVTGKVVVEYP